MCVREESGRWEGELMKEGVSCLCKGVVLWTSGGMGLGEGMNRGYREGRDGSQGN